MARITRDIRRLGKEVLGLTTDVATMGIKVMSGTVQVAKHIVDNTNVENVKNTLTYTADIVSGNEIGTANKTIEKAIADGDMGVQVAEYCLTAIHGDKKYRAEARRIEKKIADAENELDRLLLEAELVTLEKEAQKEIDKLNKQAEAMNAN